jgi:hypothetical protein
MKNMLLIQFFFFFMERRMYLMWHAGYPAGDGSFASQRIKTVTFEEKQRMENPTVAEIAKEAIRGFG